MAGHLKRLNKKQELRRIAAGRVGKMKDLSIMAVKEAAAYREVMRAEGASSEAGLKEQEDRTDMENMDFHYVSDLLAYDGNNCSSSCRLTGNLAVSTV